MPAERQVDTLEAAELLDVPPEAIRSWRKRQRIAPVGYRLGAGQGGRTPLWRLEELRPLAEAYHARVRARHADSDAG